MKRVFSMVIALFLISIYSFGGVVYTAKVSTEVMDTKEKKQMQNSPMGDMTVPITMKVYAKSKKFKAQILKGGNEITPEGSIILSSDGETVFFINPAEKTYWKMNLKQMKEANKSTMKMLKGFAKMKYSDIYVNVVDMGNGGTIAGYNTEKYKMIVKYTVEMKILFKKIKNKVRSEIELYGTKELNLNDFDVYSFANLFSSGIPEVDSQINLNVKKVGFPLKSISYSYKENGKLQSITTFEVLSLKKESVPDSMFKLPKGYKEVPGPFEKMMQQNENYGGTPDAPNSPEKSKKKFHFKDLF